MLYRIVYVIFTLSSYIKNKFPCEESILSQVDLDYNGGAIVTPADLDKHAKTILY